MRDEELTLDEQLAEALADYYDDPLGYVMFAFPWDVEVYGIQMVELQEPYKSRFPNCKYGPDKWACEFLDEWGAEIKKRAFDGRNPVLPLRFTTSSGHGIGKSTLSAWIIKFIMDTRPYCKGTVTAGTDSQLRTKTWAELGKWHSMSLTSHLFEYSNTRGSMMLKRKGVEGSWFTEAKTCRKENSENFAGQHAANSTSFYLFDEASQIEDIIYDVREGGLTDGEPMIFDFGNPTRNSGRFFENCEGKFRSQYIVRHIDSRDVAITNKKTIQESIDLRGIDSDFIKVRVLGQFPSVGDTQFMSGEDVIKAGMEEFVPDRLAPLVIGVDVARFGDDDSVVYPRIGSDARSFGYEVHHGLDTVALTHKIIDMISMFRRIGLEYSMVFVDATGGSIGGSIVDQLTALGYKATGVQFGNSATDKTYRYRGDEMWGTVRDALHEGKLFIPDRSTEVGEKLYEQLTQREFGYTTQGNKIWLETKQDMKDRGLSSPDIADALALTFAFPVERNLVPAGYANLKPQITKFEYDVNDPSRYMEQN